MRMPRRLSLFWAVYRRTERRPAMQQPADRVRAASEQRRKLMTSRVSNLLTGRTDRRVEVSTAAAKADDGTMLPLRVYRPRGVSGALPVVVNFHGGGWVSGDARQSEWWASTLAAEALVTVVSVDYRLAPEHPFPVGVDDSYAATRWVAEHADELRVDAGRIAVMGDSSGGNLAAVVAHLARDRGGPAISAQVLIYPSVDLVAGRYPSEPENATAPILGARDVDNVPLLYFHGVKKDLDNPLASPIYGNLAGLPPALVQTAQYDPLRDQGAAYAVLLRAAGSDARHTNYVDAAHGYISLPGVMPVARQALGEAAAFVAEHLGTR